MKHAVSYRQGELGNRAVFGGICAPEQYDRLSMNGWSIRVSLSSRPIRRGVLGSPPGRRKIVAVLAK
ncbi:MAG: hypothetical protein LBU80_01455 [Rikenellaceae bacterium]|nr:hypothetical protein [Rikenellaceae bacterium]